jgi:VanZ family protein
VLLLVLYVVMIFFVSTRPDLRSPGPDFALKDKIAHFVEYFVLGLLLFGSMGRTVSRSRFAAILFLVAVGTSVAALDELVQSYVPGRNMDLFDWLADAAGVSAGVVLGGFTRFASKRAATATVASRTVR